MGTCQGSRQCQSLEVISRTGKDNPKLYAYILIQEKCLSSRKKVLIRWRSGDCPCKNRTSDSHGVFRFMIVGSGISWHSLESVPINGVAAF